MKYGKLNFTQQRYSKCAIIYKLFEIYDILIVNDTELSYGEVSE